MVLHQRKVQLIVASKIHMDHRYPKKDAKPSSTTSLSTFVLGFFTFIVCDPCTLFSLLFHMVANSAQYLDYKIKGVFVIIKQYQIILTLGDSSC